MLPPIFAYIGPGAGFAFLGSFLSLIVSLFLTAGSFLLWPIRTARAILLRRHGFRKAKIQRLIFLGLDGLDPRLTARFMSEGKLPNLQRLQQQGLIPPPPHHLSIAFAGCLVDFRNRRQSRQAQHFRFSQSQFEILRSRTLIVEGAAAAPCAPHRPLPRSTLPARRRNAAQKRAILEDPWRSRDWQHDYPCAHHLPAAEVRRTPDLRNVYARFARHPGQFHPVQHSTQPGCLRKRHTVPAASLWQCFGGRSGRSGERSGRARRSALDYVPAPSEGQLIRA